MNEPVFAATPDLVDAVVAEVRSRRRDRNATVALFAVLAAVLMVFSSTHLPWPAARRGLDVTRPAPVVPSPYDDVVTSATPAAQPLLSSPAQPPRRNGLTVVSSPQPQAIGAPTPSTPRRDRSRIRLLTNDPYEQVVCPDGSGSAWRNYGDHCVLAEKSPPGIHNAAGAHLLVCLSGVEADDVLTFADSLDLEVVVSAVGGGEVWRWSDRHPGTGGPRTLRIPIGTCVNWVVAWAYVDSSGRPVPAGTYEMTLESRAEELAGLRKTFRVAYQPS